MTWNLLADQLADGFPKVNPQNLSWSTRQELILMEIERINSDILLTQELDHYSDFLDPYMKNRGFNSIFKQKGGWHRDGIAIFYRSSMFNCLENYLIDLQGPQYAIGLKLQWEDQVFYVFTTHLKAKKQYDSVRVEQVSCIFEFISKLEPHPIIMGGDFNSIPGTNAFNSLRNNRLGFTSVYDLDETRYTTIKYRHHLEMKTEDYIWIRGFDVLGYLSIPSREDIGENGLPCEKYPSDHIALATSLRFCSN
jgi:nocturnin